MKWTMAVMVLALAGPLAADTIYRCTIDGQLVFSQQPCAEDAENISQTIPAVRQADPRIERARDTSVDQIRVERRITRHENNVRAMQRSRDAEIARIRGRMDTAMNNQAGATYIQGLSTEMAAVTATYASRIDVEQREIDRLRVELDRLRD